MKKPLWNFFTLLKSKTPLLLSIDQYYYFFQAFQQMPMGHFRDYHDLRDFCKIFWLKDYEYETDFDQLYDGFVDWESLKTLLVASDKRDNADVPSVPSPQQPAEQVEPEKREVAGKTEEETPNKKTKPPKNKPEGTSETSTDKEEDFVDFELMITEQAGAATEQTKAAAYTFEHAFMLNDQAIMPFELRHFAQRLRRKVETPFKETTEELDFDYMVGQYSKYRYIDKIVYRNRDSSQSNVILLADRFGSMLSYEYLEDQLSMAIKAIPDCSFEHFYFYNLPEEHSSGHYLLKNAGKGKTLHTAEHKWGPDSRFFILSDGGALSGMVNRGRMSASLKMWNYFKTISKHVFWVNPVPNVYMRGTTAQRLKLVIPMIYPVQQELNKFFQK